MINMERLKLIKAIYGNCKYPTRRYELYIKVSYKNCLSKTKYKYVYINSLNVNNINYEKPLKNNNQIKEYLLEDWILTRKNNLQRRKAIKNFDKI